MTIQEQYRAAEERLNTYISEHSMRHTQERKIILRHAVELHRPFSADQLAEAARAEFVSKATTYNTISLLLSAQILHEVHREGYGGKAEYELMLVRKDCMRMICKKCGREVDISDKAITNVIRLRKYSNYNMEHFSLYVYGECKVCRRLSVKNKSN